MIRSRIAGVVLALAAVEGCSLFGDEPDGRYELVQTAESIRARQDGLLVLLPGGRIHWTRVHATSSGSEPHAVAGDYELRDGVLRVSWADYWYDLGRLRGDTLVVTYAGAADEPHREFYVRR